MSDTQKELVNQLLEKGVDAKDVELIQELDPSGHMLKITHEAFTNEEISMQRVSDIASYMDYVANEFGTDDEDYDFSDASLTNLPLGVGTFSDGVDGVKEIYPEISDKTAEYLDGELDWYWNAKTDTINDCISATTIPFEYPSNETLVYENKGEFLALSGIEDAEAKHILEPDDYARYTEAVEWLQEVTQEKTIDKELALNEVISGDGMIHYPAGWSLEGKEWLAEHVGHEKYAFNGLADNLNQSIRELKEEDFKPLLDPKIRLNAQELNDATDLLYSGNSAEDIKTSLTDGTFNLARVLQNEMNGNPVLPEIRKAMTELDLADTLRHRETRYIEGAIAEYDISKETISSCYEFMMRDAAKLFAEEMNERSANPMVDVRDRAEQFFIEYADKHKDEMTRAISDVVTVNATDNVFTRGEGIDFSKEFSNNRTNIEYVAIESKFSDSQTDKQDLMSYRIMQPIQAAAEEAFVKHIQQLEYLPNRQNASIADLDAVKQHNDEVAALKKAYPQQDNSLAQGKDTLAKERKSVKR